MIVPVHVAQTLPNGTFAALAAWPGRFVIEVGASDRNTADVELLPRWSDAFLVTAEPLLDKVSRALGRRAPASRAIDGYEPLGQHHARGIVLPIAVGPTRDPKGEPQTFHVGRVAGCSSLANVSKGPAHGKFGAWCQNTVENRHVWTLPLKALLGRMPARARVALLKIDAQGYDLNVVASAGDQVDRIDYVAMEVVSDDCAALYDGQPKCTEVVETMIGHGFVPLGRVECTPHFPRARFNHFCELELVFRRHDIRYQSVPREVHELHNTQFNGCEVLHAKDGHKVAGDLHAAVVASGNGWHKRYTDVATGMSSNTSFGKLYSCPAACAAPTASGGATPPSDPCPW
jgi:hypothetical protein